MTVGPQKHIDRRNNFDFLRVLFAIFVIISHASPLYGLADEDWLLVHTKTVSFSNLGLAGFFCISGFLVYQSSVRSSGYVSFLWKRVLRIFPGLIINVLLVALVLGAIVSKTFDYYRDSSVYSYIYRNVGLYRLQYCIKGVFENNPFNCGINGSLWTLCYEFSFYLLFIVFFLQKRLNKYVSWMMFPLFAMLLYLRWKHPDWDGWIWNTGMQVNQLVHFALWFVGGMLLSITSSFWMKYRVPIAAGSFVLMLGIFSRQMPVLSLYFIWPVFVLAFANCKSPVISSLDKIGDPSFGVYIYGFVVQQTLIHYFYPIMGMGAFLFWSILLSLLLGYLSWYGVEKRALRLKKRSKSQSAGRENRVALT